MNKIILIGNVVRDPASSVTQNGVRFTQFSIAVNRPYADNDGNKTADYFDIIAWRNLADNCARYLFKGSKVGIVGTMQRRTYTDSKDIKRTAYDVIAESVEFLSPKSSGQSEEAPPFNMTPVDNGDLDF